MILLLTKRIESTDNMFTFFDGRYVPLAALGIALFGCLYFITSSIRSYRKLQHIRGPPLAAFSQLWLFNVTSKGDLYLDMQRVINKYGTIVEVREVIQILMHPR